MTKKKGGSVGQKKIGKASTKDSIKAYRRDHEHVFVARDVMRRSKVAQSVMITPPDRDLSYHRLP